MYVVCCNIATIALLSTIAPNASFIEALKNSPASILESLIAGFAFIAVIGLAGFHTCLIANMQTTNEEIKGTFATKGQLTSNPYHRGNIFKNFAVVLCGPFQPSLLQNRAPYKETGEEVLVEDFRKQDQALQRQEQGGTAIEGTDSREIAESRTPPLLDDSPLINRAPTVTSQNDSLEGMEIGTTSLSVEVEIFPRESRDSMGSFADESITEEAQLLPSESINSVEH